LRQLGDCHIHDNLAAAEVLDAARGAEIVLTNKCLLRRDAIGQLPALKYIGVLATGYNVVDVETARARGIVVTNIPAYGTASVAQMVFAHILNLTQRVSDHARGVREGRWCASRHFCYWESPLVELAGRTLGIVGFGHIGGAVAALGCAFQMQVLVHTPRPPAEAPPGVQFAGLAEVLGRSDFLSLHCPLTPETRHLVNAQRLALMQSSACLINTSRGLLIDEAALADALNAGRLAGAGLDVLSVEPPEPANPLLTARNCYITPHIAWATRAARQRLMDIAVANVRAFLAGHPVNVVGG
jgi:glycerate dehydrogenase